MSLNEFLALEHAHWSTYFNGKLLIVVPIADVKISAKDKTLSRTDVSEDSSKSRSELSQWMPVDPFRSRVEERNDQSLL